MSTNCSKCEDPAVKSILVHNDGDPKPEPEEKDRRGVRVIRFCRTHWSEIAKLLP